MRFKLFIFFCLGVIYLADAETKVDKIDAAIQANSATWQTAESWVTELEPEEWSRLCGTIREPVPNASSRQITLSVSAELPLQLDWRNNDGNWVTPVRNQASCGSCWDFSATAQVEAWWQVFNKDPNLNPDLSEQFVLSCANAGSCAGGSVEAALTFYQENGVPPESCLPYQATDNVLCEEACPDWQEKALAIPGWGYVTLEEPIVENIKQAVYQHPVSASYIVYEDFYYYGGGVYEHVWGEVVGGHAILIVGWNDAEQSWICKNSWGSNWGEEGYFRIKWGDSGMGQYVPFIYDNVTQAALQISPARLDLTLRSGETTTETVRMTNAGSNRLQFSLIDYQIPIVFHPDAFNSFDGSSWWCGDPEIGGYLNHWLQYLNTPVIDLSEASQPELTFQTFLAIEPPKGADTPWDGWDGANVWISADSGVTFSVLEPIQPAYTSSSLWAFGEANQGWDMGPNIPGWAGKSDGWLPARFDLSPYIGKSVVIRFAFASDMGFSTEDDESVTGFFVDDIRVADGTNVLFFDDADDIESMSRKGFGAQVASWLQIDNAAGQLGPGESHDAELKISAEALYAGSYEGKISIASNDTTALVDIPVYLTVESQQHDLGIRGIKKPERIRVLSEFIPSATIRNHGATDAGPFDVVCEMFAADTSVYVDVFPVEGLISDASADIAFDPFVPVDSSDIKLSISIQNQSNDNIAFNDSLHADIAVTNLIDDFEADTSLWIAQGGWGVTDKYQGYESAFAAHSTGGSIPYKPNMNATLTFAPALNITKADSISLNYWAWAFTEEGEDYCYLQVSTDSITWVTVDSLSGRDPVFRQRQAPISTALTPGAEKLWLQFQFVSNASEELVGVLIDDISIFASPKVDVVGSTNQISDIPLDWRLEQNYPNPFNPSTTIQYSIPEPAYVDISIYSLTGRKIATVVNDMVQAGLHSATWQPRDAASGVYFYRLNATAETGENFNAFKKMLFVK